MAIALPPPPEPQLVAASEIRDHAKMKVAAGALVFYVADRCAIGSEQVVRVTQAAKTPSDIVRGLSASCYALGYPAVSTRYGVDGTTLYIEVQPGRISSVEAPAPIKSYFDGIEKSRVTKAADLEMRRVLADAVSERAGDDYQMRLVPDGLDRAKLVIDNPTPGRDRLQMRAGFATNGNRYSGRYIADGLVRYSWGDGTEAQLGYAAAVRPKALRDDQSGPYQEASGTLTRVTPAGIFGIDGRYVDLQPRVPAIDASGMVFPAGLDGEISEGGLSWLLPLHASFTDRVNLSLRVARLQQTFEFEGERLLTERYTKGNISLSMANRFVIGAGHLFELQGGIDLAQGFTSTPFTPSTGGRGQFSIARPAIRLSYLPGARFTPALEASAQVSTAALPQAEQVVLGGDAQRAFEPGTAAGDQGWRGRATLSHRRLSLGWLSLEPTLFAEYGAARFRDPATAASSGTAERAAVGLEATLRLGSVVELSAFAAEPVHSAGPSLLADDERRLGARLTITY